MLNQCHIGDCRELLKQFAAAGVRAQMCVTSPPYFGLRDYGTGTWTGGSSECDHTRQLGGTNSSTLGDYDNGLTAETIADKVLAYGRASYRDTCGKCGATRVDRQIGLEPTLGDWVDTMVEVFRLVRDVLADDGTLWLNLGDAYANDGKWGGSTSGKHAAGLHGQTGIGRAKRDTGLKQKDLMGQPWRVALALQDDGWYLRQDIIWHKPNPMPESIADRCTKAHEYVFLLAKQPRYFYDFDAMQEPVSGTANARGNGVNPKAVKMPDGWDTGAGAHGSFHRQGREKGKTRKLGAKLEDAPDEVRASASARMGRGAGWRNKQNESFSGSVNELTEKRNRRSVWTIGTEPFDGAHFATFPRALVDPCIIAGSRKGDVVLDPFMGSGTTAAAAEHLGRQWIGCELNADYMPLQARRLQQRAMVF